MVLRVGLDSSVICDHNPNLLTNFQTEILTEKRERVRLTGDALLPSVDEITNTNIPQTPTAGRPLPS